MGATKPLTEPLTEPLRDRAAAREGMRLYLNASAVSLVGQGIAILGASGTGKSALALALIGLGAELIADDGVWCAPEAGGLVLHRPDTAPPLIEVRGIGLLNAGPIVLSAPLVLVVDLDRAETERLPPRRRLAHDGHDALLILGADRPMLAQSLVHLVRHGRAEP